MSGSVRKDVRIVLLGDEGAGKSSLVSTLIRETFAEIVPHIVPEVTIPPEVTTERVATHIIDTSSRPEHRDTLEEEIRKANVISLIYAIDNEQSFDSIAGYWIPYIRQLGVNVPFIVVGNKIDLRGSDVTNPHLEDQIVPLMNEFKEIVTCIECSARAVINVSEVFYFAQKAVLHPTAPLYDCKEHKLKPKCVDALKRIFKLCDVDKDGILSDEELNEFQRKCFNTPLQPHEIEGVKQIVLEKVKEGVVRNGLSEVGFLYLHALFVQRGRLETTWTVLRKFGYGDDLSLREDYLVPKIDIPSDCAIEPSSKAYQFFTELFKSCDKDQDGALNSSELKELFLTSPGNPWDELGFPEDTTVTNKSGSVTLQGFLAQWSMTTLLDYRTTLRYLAYLGYPGDRRAAITTQPRRSESSRKKRNIRNVFLCCVIGAPHVGKSALLRGLIGKPFIASDARGSATSVVNSVEVRGAEKYLVMYKVPSNCLEEFARSKDIVPKCDVICWVYDSSDARSFDFLIQTRNQYESLAEMPSVFVATKSDLDVVQQRTEIQPIDYCKRLGISPPVYVSMKNNISANIYHHFVSVSIDPTAATPRSNARKSRLIVRVLKWTGTIAIISASAYVLYRYFKPSDLKTRN